MQRQGKLYLKFLLSYLLILLIPMAVGSYSYTQMVKVLRDDAAQMNLAVLAQSESNMELLLREVRDVVTQLSLDSELLKLMLTTDTSWTPQTLYSFSLQKKELNKLSTNKMISKLYVYLPRSKTILSSDRIIHSDDETLLVGNSRLEEWLANSVSDTDQDHFKYLEQVQDGSATGSYLAYVAALPAGSGARANGTVVVLVDVQSVMNMLRPLLVHPHSFAYIADGYGATIAAGIAADGAQMQQAQEAQEVQEVQQVQQVQLPNDAASSYFTSRVNGEQMLVTYTRSSNQGWTFVSGIPTKVLFSKVDFMRRINWTLILAALAISCIIAVLLSYRNAKPLLEMLESLKEMIAGEGGKRRSEMDQLKVGVQQMMNSHRHLHFRMRQQQPIIRAAYIEQMLKGGFYDEMAKGLHQQEAQITWYEENMVIAVIQLHDMKYDINIAVEEQLNRSQAVKLTLNQILQAGCYMHQLQPDRFVYIYSFPGSEGEEQVNSFIQLLHQLQNDLQQRHAVMAGIGVGQLYHSSSELWLSYNEAVQAVEFIAADAAQQLIQFAHLHHNADQYYFPLELEMKLMNTVRTGDSRGLEQSFELLETQNFQLRQLHSRAKQMLLHELEGTLQKLSEYVQVPSRKPTHHREAAIARSEMEQADQRYQSLKAMFCSICEQIQHQQETRQELVLHHVVTYIQTHYCDSNLNLRTLASDSQQTESALSTCFKEQMGVTYSEYVEQLRLAEACRLLNETVLPVQEIALQVGYNSDKSFRRAFKRVQGILPTDYRKKLS